MPEIICFKECMPKQGVCWRNDQIEGLKKKILPTDVPSLEYDPRKAFTIKNVNRAIKEIDDVARDGGCVNVENPRVREISLQYTKPK